MSITAEIAFLHRLCQIYGVQTSYTDVFRKRRRSANPEALLNVLRSLGVHAGSLSQVPNALKTKEMEIAQQVIEPVIIVRTNGLAKVNIRINSSQRSEAAKYFIKLESGREISGRWKMESGRFVKSIEIGKTDSVQLEFTLGERLPSGYHKLALEIGNSRCESLIIASHGKCFAPEQNGGSKLWGVFLPLYALRKHGAWGGADYSSLSELLDWVGERGGTLAGTLPLLPGFLNTPVSISPYLPISRLAWNEFYIDIDSIPQFQDYSEAQAVIRSHTFQAELSALKDLPLVDYERQLALKRSVLEAVSRSVLAGNLKLSGEVKAFAEANPDIMSYAKFRSVCERTGASWQSWSGRQRGGDIREADYDWDVFNYHLYAQFLAFRQMDGVSEAAERDGVHLYLDLPLGVHPDGYDAWRFRESFIQGGRVGAPPDIVFTKGQNWGLPPPHPQKIRENGYDYFIKCIRHHLKYADVLRIDHVMGFHRLFCIPPGAGAEDGVYIRYPAEEVYAVLAVESERAKAMIVGEDLGMVPGYVRPAMKKHNLQSMYVLHYELAGGGVNPVPADTLACLNTHDMPPFAAFWQGVDIERRLEIGLISKQEAESERTALAGAKKQLADFLKKNGWLGENEETLEVMKACLNFLSSSPARIMLINLEDLWLETKPQNIPSTGSEYPNWRHKASLSFEEFCQNEQVVDILRKVGELRRTSSKNDGILKREVKL